MRNQFSRFNFLMNLIIQNKQDGLNQYIIKINFYFFLVFLSKNYSKKTIYSQQKIFKFTYIQKILKFIFS